MRIAVSDLNPNPFRDLKRYPIDQTKVDALVVSIKDTDFWDNLVARKCADGGYELAYGVHRLAALKKAGVKEVDIPVRKLDDTIMLKMMAHENSNRMVALGAYLSGNRPRYRQGVRRRPHRTAACHSHGSRHHSLRPIICRERK